MSCEVGPIQSIILSSSNHNVKAKTDIGHHSRAQMENLITASLGFTRWTAIPCSRWAHKFHTPLTFNRWRELTSYRIANSRVPIAVTRDACSQLASVGRVTSKTLSAAVGERSGESIDVAFLHPVSCRTRTVSLGSGQLHAVQISNNWKCIGVLCETVKQI